MDNLEPSQPMHFFYGIPPNLARALLLASEEQLYWSLAKTQGSSSLEPVDSQ
jgi:hypothetical protein